VWGDPWVSLAAADWILLSRSSLGVSSAGSDVDSRSLFHGIGSTPANFPCKSRGLWELIFPPSLQSGKPEDVVCPTCNIFFSRRLLSFRVLVLLELNWKSNAPRFSQRFYDVNCGFSEFSLFNTLSPPTWSIRFPAFSNLSGACSWSQGYRFPSSFPQDLSRFCTSPPPPVTPAPL